MKSYFFISLMNGAAWGGSEELWFQAALYAARQNNKVACAFYEWPQKQERIQRLREAGCEVFLFSNKARTKKTFIERLQHKLTKRRVKTFARSLPLTKYDVTIINLGYLEIVSHYWKDFHRYVKNYTLLFHVHNDDEYIKPKRKKILKKWILNARHNLFASTRIKKFLEKELSIHVPNASTLINPITFPAPAQPTGFPPLHNGNYVFIMLAALEVRRKAQDSLIKALALEKWKDRNWQLFLYGTGESDKHLRDLIEQYNLGDKVILKGHTSDVKQALSEAHLLLQMTHIDAMPLAVVEALSMAKPLLVSNTGDMPEWVQENVNGWVAERATLELIDMTLEKAWQNRERWEEMGKRSFELFKEKFPEVPEEFFLKQVNE